MKGLFIPMIEKKVSKHLPKKGNLSIRGNDNKLKLEILIFKNNRLMKET